MSVADSLQMASPSARIYEPSNRIRKKPSSSSLSDCEEEHNTSEEEVVIKTVESETLQPKPTTPSLSRPNTPIKSPITRNFHSLTPYYSPSMLPSTNANIHSIFNKLNTLNEKTKQEDKRSFLHSIKGHMRKNSKEKFHSLFEPIDGSSLNDSWRGSPLQAFSTDELQQSPTLSHSPLKSPTVNSYSSFAKSTTHSKKRLANDNTVEEIVREMEQYYVQNNQKIESYIDQIALLEKQKPHAVQESKQWKKRSIQAENQLHNQEMEFREEIRKLNEKHLRDLEGIKRAHRNKCQQHGEMIKKLLSINEAFRAQLQESGIAPVTAIQKADLLVESPEWDEEHEFIKQTLAAIEKRKTSLRLEEEMAAEIEYITLALGVELRQTKVKVIQEMSENLTKRNHRMGKQPRRRSAIRTPRSRQQENSLGLRAVNKEKSSSPRKEPSTNSQTKHQELIGSYVNAKEPLGHSSDKKSTEGNNTPLRFITLTRGSSSRRNKHNLNCIPCSSAQSSTASTTTIGSTDPEEGIPTLQLEMDQPFGEEGNTTDTHLSSSDTDSQTDVALSTPLPYEEAEAELEAPYDPTRSTSSPRETSSATLESCNTPSFLVSSPPVFNPIRTESPSQKIISRPSTPTPHSTNSPTTTTITPKREQSSQLQHTPAMRRKPLSKTPEVTKQEVL